jgi:DNA-binding HxlR family transcriptional regulator
MNTPRTDRHPLQVAVVLLCKKWKPLVLWALRNGPMRFNPLQRALVGITPKVLIDQLRELERHRLIERHVEATRAKHVSYALTPLGESCVSALTALNGWGEHYLTNHARRPGDQTTSAARPGPGKATPTDDGAAERGNRPWQDRPRDLPNEPDGDAPPSRR